MESATTEILAARAHNSHLAISGLHSEMIEAIFHYAIAASRRTTEVFVIPDDRRILLTLSAISYSWRLISRGDGTLWTNIRCTWNHNLVVMFLQLSDPHLVSLDLFPRDGGSIAWVIPGRRHDSLLSSIKLCLWYSNRIGRLNADSTSSINSLNGRMSLVRVEIAEMFASNQHELRSVQTLTISGAAPLDSQRDIELLSKLTNNRSLQNLRIGQVELGLNLPSLLNWTLRRLYIQARDYQTCMFPDDWRQTVSHLAPYLEHLHLETPALVQKLSEGPLIQMTRLKYFAIYTQDWNTTTSFLMNMTFAQSSSMVISVVVRETVPQEAWSIIASFLNRHHQFNKALKFALSHSAETFSFNAINTEACITIRPICNRQQLPLNHASAEMAVAKIDDLFCDMKPDLKAQIIELFIYEEENPTNTGDNDVFPSVNPNWGIIAGDMPNVIELSISSGPPVDRALGYSIDPYGKYNLPGNCDISQDIHSSLLALLSSQTGGHLFPRLQVLWIMGHKLEGTESRGERQLLTLLEQRAYSCPIQSLLLDDENTISASFRREIALASPLTVVTIDGQEIPASCDGEDIFRGSFFDLYK